VDVQVAADQATAAVGEGLRRLFERGELCDLTLVVHETRFPAHKAMLAAMSSHFRAYLQQHSRGGGGGAASSSSGGGSSSSSGAAAAASSGDAAGAALMAGLLQPTSPAAASSSATGAAPPAEAAPAAAEATAASSPPPEGGGGEASPPSTAAATEAPKAPEEGAKKAGGSSARHLELDVLGLNAAEGVKIMLDYMYSISTSSSWEYAPTSVEVNRDVLRLAQHFNLPHLHEHAARWLAKGLTTSNVVSRLVICEELGLGLLRDKIIEQLTAHPAGLTMVSTSAEIMKHPKILQELLIAVASVHSSAGEKKAAEKEKEEKEKATSPPAKEPEVQKEEEKEKEEEEKKKPAKAAPKDKGPPPKKKRGA